MNVSSFQIIVQLHRRLAALMKPKFFNVLKCILTYRVGEHNPSTTSDGQHQDIEVAKIISHPSYSRSTFNNDIALIKLERPVILSKYVKQVCLPDQDQDVPIGTECYITGICFDHKFLLSYLKFCESIDVVS